MELNQSDGRVQRYNLGCIDGVTYSPTIANSGVRVSTVGSTVRSVYDCIDTTSS